MASESELNFTSLVTQIIFVARSIDWDSQRDSEIVSIISQMFSYCSSEYPIITRVYDLDKQIKSLKPKLEFLSLTNQISSHVLSPNPEWKIIFIISKIIFLVSSMALDSESELVSLIKKIISLFNSKPDSESELVSLVTQLMRLGVSVDSDTEPTQESELVSLIRQLVSLKPERRLTSLIWQTISSCRSLNWEPKKLINLCPQVKVTFDRNLRKFCSTGEEEEQQWKNKKEGCHFQLQFLRSSRKDYFHCRDCNGEDHEEEYDKAPVEVKHSLHPRHSLQLALFDNVGRTRGCYCCGKDLDKIFYYCEACDYAMNIACVEKPPVLSIDHPKWHEHTLVHLPRRANSLTCDMCALVDSSCPIYVCLPCDFVVHQSCLNLPHVIRISRHPHRISFTPSFSQRDLSCSVCRKKMDKNYGGYSCFKDGCSYVTHSRCATQSNVWDGIELEGMLEEIDEEDVEPFVRISNGVIQHFSHQHHHLRLHDNMGMEYDENKQCQACITPIYFGNFYSCMTCDFILHEECANLSLKVYHPIHPHLLTLVRGFDGNKYEDHFCSACDGWCTGGFSYRCSKKKCTHHGCTLHVQCATISEPLVHKSHMHPLFLTSKPEERRKCWVCKHDKTETFNCIEECDFALCFKCATIPQKVRYKHDKNMLTLSNGETTSTMTDWCEACEGKIDPKGRFYKCDEYCCVTLHIECLIGEDLYIKPGSSWIVMGKKVCVVPNNQHMSRPICFQCKKYCPHKTVFQMSESIFCSRYCLIVACSGVYLPRQKLY